MATSFVNVYNRFLSKVTDDMYIELTPEDTIRDLRNLLINGLPGFEFPRFDAYAYTLDEIEKSQDEVEDTDFVIGTVWDSMDDEISDDLPPNVIVENSSFDADLNSEEINILAILMMIGWVQRQITSIENTRMKYSGTDLKFTSQANHLSKLLTLLSECQRQSHHYQRLYKRRRINSDKRYRSNWDIFGNGVYSGVSSSAFIKPKKDSSTTTQNGSVDNCYSYWEDLDNPNGQSHDHNDDSVDECFSYWGEIGQ